MAKHTPTVDSVRKIVSEGINRAINRVRFGICEEVEEMFHKMNEDDALALLSADADGILWDHPFDMMPLKGQLFVSSNSQRVCRWLSAGAELEDSAILTEYLKEEGENVPQWKRVMAEGWLKRDAEEKP